MYGPNSLKRDTATRAEEASGEKLQKKRVSSQDYGIRMPAAKVVLTG